MVYWLFFEYNRVGEGRDRVGVDTREALGRTPTEASPCDVMSGVMSPLTTHRPPFFVSGASFTPEIEPLSYMDITKSIPVDNITLTRVYTDHWYRSRIHILASLVTGLDRSIFLIGLTAAAVVGLATVPLAVTVQDSTNDVLKKVTSETVATLDHAWEIALKFKDPNYVYDPQEFIDAAQGLNDTIAGIDFSNVTITG
jgi:hypothetical protein